MDSPGWQPPTNDEGAVPPLASPPPPPGTPTVPVSTPGPSKRRAPVVVGAVIGVVAMGLAGLFAVQRLGGSSDGGAATPDELGSTLLAAVASEDVLGVIDTLLPGERDSLGEPFVEFVSELRRLEVLADSTDLGGLSGFDVELADERVTVRTTNVTDIVNIELAATATVTVDGATVPIGRLIEDRVDENDLTDLRDTRSSETDDLELDLTAVEQDGRWYFSLFHTVAESAREAADAGDIPDPGIEPDGADSPEAAVDRLLDRVGDLDLVGLISVLDPAEATALQRYAPLFVEDAQAALDEVPLRWRVDVREFRAEGEGDERTVLFDSLGITGDLDGVDFSVLFGDGCVRLDIDGETIEQCGTEPEAELDDLLAEAPDLDEVIDVVAEAFADLEPIGLELRRRDGAWFVSPFATGTEAVLTVMRALDAAEIAAIVDAGQDLLADASDAVLQVIDDGGLDTGSLDAGVDAGLDAGLDGGSLDPVDDGGSLDSFDTESADRCFAIEDAAAAGACFQEAIDAGEIDPIFAPLALIHPECGIAELSWQGGWYELSDEEFTAAMLVAVPCFDALVASGELPRWVLPFEVLYFYCFEGRNWFTEFEADYNDRVSACIDATPVEDE